MNDFSPFPDQRAFEFADLLYSKVQCSEPHIDRFCDILSAYICRKCHLDSDDPDNPPASSKDVYEMIDDITEGDVPWECFKLSYEGDVEPNDTTPWKRDEYEVWYRNPRDVLHSMLGNRAFEDKMDLRPKIVRDRKGRRLYFDLMSGDWAWNTAVSIFSFSLFHLD